MAEKTLGPEFWIHGGGLDLVFPHHENERAQSQAVGRPFARIWMHNGLLRFMGEKMSKSVGNVATIQEVIAEWGRGDRVALPHDGPLAQAARVLARGDDGRDGCRSRAFATRFAARPAPTGDWEPWPPSSTTTSTRLPHSPCFHRWAREGALDELRRGLDVFGLGALGDTVEAPASDRRARPGAERGPGGARFRGVRSPARRDRRRRLGGARRAGRLRARAAAVTRELIYGRNAVREALRGRREVLELWVSERAAASLEWLGEGPRAAGRQGARADRGGREPRSSGRRRLGRARTRMPTRGSWPRARSRCWRVSTRSPTRATSAL